MGATDAGAARRAAVSDASARGAESGAAGTGPDAALDDASLVSDAGGAEVGSLPPLVDCALEPQPSSRLAPSMVVSNLADLCAALETAGIARCPSDRAALLGSLRCEPGEAFPLLDRRCGVDHLFVSRDATSVTWYFDAATGALVGARALVPAGQLPCGTNKVYVGGPVLPPCHTSEGSCQLCVGVPDTCPPDISASIPSVDCPAAAPEASPCGCGEVGTSGIALPAHGDACGGADQCARCSAGTCWADCLCWRSGALRYVRQCTE